MPVSVVVIGDVIVDEYWHGVHLRTNTENGKRVVRIVDRNRRLGGAAAVAMIARGFGCRVALCGNVGDDEPGQWVLNELWDDGIGTHGIERVRLSRTTVKTRVIVDGVCDGDRLDFDEYRSYDASQLRDVNADVVVVCDYGKGVVSPSTVEAIRKVYRGEVIVDPWTATAWSHYAGASIIKCNQQELLGEMRRLSVGTVRQVAAVHGCHVVATDGSNGCDFGDFTGDAEHLPATGTQCVDVTGAGDTVAAALAATYGMSLKDRCEFAMVAAGEQVRTIGIRRLSCELPSTSTVRSA